MSSLYKNLSEEDLKNEKENLKSFEKKFQGPSNNAAFKAAVIGAFIFSLISLAGSVYLYQSFNKEKRQRQALETSQQQIQEKAEAFEQTAKQNQVEMTRLGDQVKKYSNLRQEIAKQLADSRKEVTGLRSKIKEIEERSLAMQKEAEEIQTGFDSLPIGPELHQEKQDSVTAEPAVIKEPQVLSVNHKFNFVVANLGLKDNLDIGDILNIEREGKTIGTVTIEKVYDNFAAATINDQPKDAPIQQGDAVSKAS